MSLIGEKVVSMFWFHLLFGTYSAVTWLILLSQVLIAIKMAHESLKLFPDPLPTRVISWVKMWKLEAFYSVLNEKNERKEKALKNLIYGFLFQTSYVCKCGVCGDFRQATSGVESMSNVNMMPNENEFRKSFFSVRVKREKEKAGKK